MYRRKIPFIYKQYMGYCAGHHKAPCCCISLVRGSWWNVRFGQSTLYLALVLRRFSSTAVSFWSSASSSQSSAQITRSSCTSEFDCAFALEFRNIFRYQTAKVLLLLCIRVQLSKQNCLLTLFHQGRLRAKNTGWRVAPRRCRSPLRSGDLW